MNHSPTDTHIKTISPVDGSIYVERRLATDREVEQSIALSRVAQKQWQSFSIRERASICERAVGYFESNKDQIAQEITWQMGRPISKSGGEINGLAERARHMIEIAEESLADEAPPEKSGFTRFIRRDPLGIIFCVAPWNYPLLTTVNSVIPALMAGNSVILKPSAQTPLCGEHFALAFKEAGLPDSVLQCLFLNHDSTTKIINESKINFTCFTGSVSAGKKIEIAASGTFIGTGLELGGKDPAYVRPDVNFDNCVTELVDGAFFNSGQSCCGIERIYVHSSLHSKFVDAFVEKVRQLKLDDPCLADTTLGPVVKNSAANWVRNQIREAKQKGASACIDSSNYTKDTGDSPYLAPQVLINVDHSMSMMREESFGPIVGIMSVSDDQNAITLMNDSDLGLTASIWTQDQEAAETLGNQIETGTVFMNHCDYLDPALAWTGVKNTGHGVTLSRLGYLQLSQPKSFNLKNI